MKKIGYLLLLCLCAMGAIGGVGYSLYCGAYPIAVGVVVLAYSAFPKVKEYYNKIIL